MAVVVRGNKEEKVYIPNTGRLGELLLPGTEVLLEAYKGKFKHRILYVYYEGYPVFIDSIFTNKIIKDFLHNKKIPGYEEFSIVSSEPGYGKHRFDFLLSDKNNHWQFIEIKSCTLAWDSVASFPDAVSQRAEEHVKALAETDGPHLSFIIFHPEVSVFIPNYHTDYRFYQALKKNYSKLTVHAYKIAYNASLQVDHLSEVPVIIPDINDEGLILHLVRVKEEYALITEAVPGDMLKVEKRKRSFMVNNEKISSLHKLPLRGVARDDERFAGLEELSSGKAQSENGDDVYYFNEDPMKLKEFWRVLFMLRYSDYR